MTNLWVNSSKWLILLIFPTCCMLTVALEDVAPVEMTRSLLMADGRYQLRWGLSGQTDDQIITFEVTAETLGWVGMGLSPNGAMKNADMVVGGVDDASGKAYLYDMYAECNCHPKLDKHSDYNLLSGRQNDTHTVITFSRKVSTCDVEDFALELESPTVRIIWALHPDDVTSPESFPKHDSLDRGSRSTFLLQAAEPAAIELPDDVKYIDLTVDDVKIPDDWDTLYWCKIMQLPTWGKHHMIKFAPIITEGNQQFLHHAVIYLCAKDMQGLVGMQEACFNRNFSDFSPIHGCQDATFITWAVGSEGFALPEGYGFPLMEEGTSPYLVLEVHYNNAGHKPAPTLDNSGLRLYVTPNLRPVEYGMFSMGMGVSPETLVIPPGQNDIKMYGICDYQCTRKLPPDGINVASGFLHEHGSGTGVQLRHFRGGKELPPILADLNYDDNYQEQIHRKEHVKIMPNDTLIIECTYNTMEKSEPTYGGFGTKQEMCFVFLNYYPKNHVMENCISSPHTGSFAVAMGTKSMGLLENIFVHPTSGKNITIEEYSKTVDWGSAEPDQMRSAKGDKFQQELLTGSFWETCGGKIAKGNEPKSKLAGSVQRVSQPSQEILLEPIAAPEPEAGAPSADPSDRDSRLASIETRPRIEELEYDFFFGLKLDFPTETYSKPDPCFDSEPTKPEPETEPEPEWTKPETEPEPEWNKPEPDSKETETMVDGKKVKVNDVAKQTATTTEDPGRSRSSALHRATLLQLVIIPTAVSIIGFLWNV